MSGSPGPVVPARVPGDHNGQHSPGIRSAKFGWHQRVPGTAVAPKSKHSRDTHDS